MADAPNPLVLDLVEWIAAAPRPYADVLDRWRTSCPRLTVWEDALDRGFVKRTAGPVGGALVIATESGKEFLRDYGRATQSSMTGVESSAGSNASRTH